MSNSNLPTKAKRPSTIVLIVIIALAAVAIGARFSRQLADGDNPGYVVSLVAIAFVLVGVIVGALFLHSARAQKAQRRALAEREPGAIAFGSNSLSSVASFVRRAIPALGLGDKPKGLSASSPTGAINESGFRLFYGGAKLKLSYAIPREHIIGVAIGEISEGIHVHSSLRIVVDSACGAVVIPVPVTREGTPMRRESPAGVHALAQSAASTWSVPFLDDSELAAAVSGSAPAT